MKELYLEVYSDVDVDGLCSVPLETLLVLFLYKYCDCPQVFVTLVVSKKTGPGYQVKLSNVLFDVVEELEQPADVCRLPVIVVERDTCIAGLCSVLRTILQTVDVNHPLLGFKLGCLKACAETSLWTRFCEVDIVQAVKDEFLKEYKGVVMIPESLARFEFHMAEPVRTHNIQKQKLDHARAAGHVVRSGLPDSRLELLEELEHMYAEGPVMCVADLMILPCVYLIIQHIGSVYLQQHLPLTIQWFNHMLTMDSITESLKLIRNVERKLSSELHVNYQLPSVAKKSLYNSEPRRSRPRFMKQENVTPCLDAVMQLNITLPCSEDTFGHDVDFDWNLIPYDAQPEGGDLPEKRRDRKSQQLENLVKAVLKIAKHGDKIVDFCSGSGHLGLILAHCLPRCTVVLLENKEISLTRARTRAVKLKLTNVIFCQSNIDYFIGKFDIGVALHACGVATDLVLDCCLTRNAAFICCPCCYGKIEPNHMVSYPRSHTFRTTPLTVKEYLVIAHTSDNTHEGNTVTTEGHQCMEVIDSDRLHQAREMGYSVALSKLYPPTCTPKNNLLIGLRLERNENILLPHI